MTDSTRTVTVTRQRREVTYLNTKGEEKVLGHVAVEDYQAEVKRFLFSPVANNRWANAAKRKEEYALGTGSNSLEFVNPADAQRTLTDLGWTIQAQYAMKGGLQMTTVFNYPDTVFQDEIEYDRELWGKRGDLDSMWPGIVLETNLTIGRMAARYQPGVYRLICTNGLVGKFVGMPVFDFRHNDWNPDRVESELEELDLANLNRLPKGPVVTQVRYLAAGVKVLRDYLDERKGSEGVSPRFKFLENELSGLSTNRVKPWALEGYMKQLQFLVDVHGKDSQHHVHSMDLLNCFTSAVNSKRLGGNDRGTWAAMSVADQVIGTTASLASLAAMFSNN